MKITVAKKDLEKALQVVSNSMSGTETDMSSQFVFRPLEGTSTQAEVLTFSGRLFSSCPFTANVSGVEDDADGAFTVEGSRLRQWLRSVSDSSLSLDYDPEEKVVVATAPRGSQEFRSLDPKSFPYWDGLMSDVEVTAIVEAGRLANALTFAKQFIGDTKMESTSPSHCVTEVREGAFLSNDKRAGCMVSVPGLERCEIRVFTGDVGGILKFLATVPSDEQVDVLEHARGFLLRREDGAVFGETKYQAAFPKMQLPMEHDDELWWAVPKDEIKSAIPFLQSGADADDNRLHFSRESLEGPIQVGMVATTGNLKTLSIDLTDSGMQEDLPEEAKLPSFELSVTCLQKVIAGAAGSVLRFGINRHRNSGYVRFREDRGDDKYLTVMAWLRK